jgi:hypothetical protein
VSPARTMAGANQRRRYNFRASFVQGNPSKSNEKSLDLLGFPWPNLDFSKGYDESK